MPLRPLFALAAIGPVGSASAYVQWDPKTVWGPTELHPGEDAMFTITVQNSGTTASAGQIKIVDHFPLGVTFKEAFDLRAGTASGRPR